MPSQSIQSSALPNPEGSRNIAAIFDGSYDSELATQLVLHVLPRVTVSWDEFQKHAPPYSIALDGFVRGEPRVNIDGPHVNFNHHEGVDRLGTRSTCAQVLMAIKQGLLETFSLEGQRRMHIFVNDSDQDTSLAVWLLSHFDRVNSNSEPLVNRLVSAEDMLDATAGAYLFNPESKLMRQMNWIFDPYAQARKAGRVSCMKGAELANVIAAIGERISRYSLGEGDELPLDLRLDTIGGGKGWSLIREVGSAARTRLFQTGVRAFISVQNSEGGSFTYSIGKMSPFVRFPIDELYAVFNRAEGLRPGSPNAWGGGDTIGGSPRQTGSFLAPPEIEQLVNLYLEQGRASRFPGSNDSARADSS